MSKRILLIVIAVFALALSLLLVSCGKKTALTAAEFTELVEKAEYSLAGEATRFNDGVTASIEAISADGAFAVEFYVFSSTDKAHDTSAEIDNKLKSLGGTGVLHSTNIYYRGTNSGTFHFASRVDNTLIYVETEAKNRDAASKILKTLGYW